MTLGGDEPTGGTMRAYDDLPARPDVRDEGAELEVVWYPHRDALSLLEDGPETRHEDHTAIRGDIRTPEDSSRSGWSWLG